MPYTIHTNDICNICDGKTNWTWANFTCHSHRIILVMLITPWKWGVITGHFKLHHLAAVTVSPGNHFATQGKLQSSHVSVKLVKNPGRYQGIACPSCIYSCITLACFLKCNSCDVRTLVFSISKTIFDDYKNTSIWMTVHQ